MKKRNQTTSEKTVIKNSGPTPLSVLFVIDPKRCKESCKNKLRNEVADALGSICPPSITLAVQTTFIAITEVRKHPEIAQNTHIAVFFEVDCDDAGNTEITLTQTKRDICIFHVQLTGNLEKCKKDITNSLSLTKSLRKYRMPQGSERRAA